MKFKKLYVESSADYKLFCDLDGVLVNLNKAIKVFGLGGFEEIDANDLQGVLWNKIKERGSDFWALCPWQKDGLQLWEYIKSKDPTILTAPPNTGIHQAEKGKKDWVKRELGQSVKCIVTPAKKKADHARANSILIDDMEKNINQWVAAGGIGILHKNSDDTIKRLKELGI